MLLCLVKGSNGRRWPGDESGEVCSQAVEAVGAAFGEERAAQGVLDSFEEVLEDLCEPRWPRARRS